MHRVYRNNASKRTFNPRVNESAVGQHPALNLLFLNRPTDNPHHNIKMSWDPNQYLKYESARNRPATDLLNRAIVHLDDVKSVHSVLDLGCGTGNMAELLCRSFPNAYVDGVDSSNEMIIHALRDHKGLPDELKERLSFRVNSAENESLGVHQKYDVVYTNAALHWCLNHEVLLPNLIHNLLKPKGVLAIQMPDTRLQASHVLMTRAAENCGVYDKVKDVRIPRADEGLEWYFNLLRPLCTEVDLWTTEYIQQLPTAQIPPSPHTAYAVNSASTMFQFDPPTRQDSKADYKMDFKHTDVAVDTTLHHPVYDFVKSSGLLPYLAALGGENSLLGVQFVNEYNSLLHEAYPIVRVDNKITGMEEFVTLMPFRRMFIVCKL